MNRKTEHTVINFPEQDISLNQNQSYRQNIAKKSTRPVPNNTVDISNMHQHIDDSDEDQSDSEYTVSDDEGSEYSDDDIDSIEYPPNNPPFTKLTNIPSTPYKNQNIIPQNSLPQNTLPQNNLPKNPASHNLQKPQPLSQHRKPANPNPNVNKNYQQPNQIYQQPNQSFTPQPKSNQQFTPQSQNNMFNQPNLSHNVPFNNTGINQYNYQQHTKNDNHPQHNT